MNAEQEPIPIIRVWFQHDDESLCIYRGPRMLRINKGTWGTYSFVLGRKGGAAYTEERIDTIIKAFLDGEI